MVCPTGLTTDLLRQAGWFWGSWWTTGGSNPRPPEKEHECRGTRGFRRECRGPSESLRLQYSRSVPLGRLPSTPVYSERGPVAEQRRRTRGSDDCRVVSCHKPGKMSLPSAVAHHRVTDRKSVV